MGVISKNAKPGGRDSRPFAVTVVGEEVVYSFSSRISYAGGGA
jgi:hypothetical protein